MPQIYKEKLKDVKMQLAGFGNTGISTCNGGKKNYMDITLVDIVEYLGLTILEVLHIHSNFPNIKPVATKVHVILRR